MRLASLGEILWDLIGNQELLGGATFNFSVQLSRLGHDVSFLSAVGDDDRGRRALAAASRLGLSTKFIRTVKDAPTGTVSVFVDTHGQPSYVLHRPAAYDFAALPLGHDHLGVVQTGFAGGADVHCGTWKLRSMWRSEEPVDPEWLYHGTLHFMEPRIYALRHCYPDARRFYDINLRKDSYTTPLVTELLQLADVVKLNDEELVLVQQMIGTSHASIENFCRDHASRFGWSAVCVTRGERGCAILKGDKYVEVPGVPVKVADAVGAGDAFAAAFLHGLDQGWPAEKIGAFANRLGALVASRPGGIPEWFIGELNTD